MAKSAPLRKSRQFPAQLTALGEIQKLMAQAVMRPLTRREGTQRTWADGRATAEVAGSILKPNDRLNSFERLQIYNQQYWWRLLGCFQDDFRGVRAVLGERKFDGLAVAYLEAHGSTSWSLRDLGQQVPAFLRAHPELSAPHTELAIEMAEVEWAKVQAFDTAGLPPIDPQKMARRDPAKLRLKLQPYVALLTLRFPIDQLIRKQREASVETGSASNAVSATSTRRRAPRLLRAKASEEPIHLAVHRVDFSVYYKRLAPEAFALLSALRSGATLADACEAAFAQSSPPPEEAAAKLGEWFNVWTRLGWLAA